MWLILSISVASTLTIAYIMKHKVMNQIITYKYNNNNEEIPNYYFSFIKSLAVRLDNTTLQYFLNDVTHTLIIGIE